METPYYLEQHRIEELKNANNEKNKKLNELEEEINIVIEMAKEDWIKYLIKVSVYILINIVFFIITYLFVFINKDAKVDLFNFLFTLILIIIACICTAFYDVFILDMSADREWVIEELSELYEERNKCLKPEERDSPSLPLIVKIVWCMHKFNLVLCFIGMLGLFFYLIFSLLWVI